MDKPVRVKLVWVASDTSKNRYDSVDAFFSTVPRIGEQVDIQVKARWKHIDGFYEEFSPLYGRVYDVRHFGFTQEYGDAATIWIYVNAESPPRLTPGDESEI